MLNTSQHTSDQIAEIRDTQEMGEVAGWNCSHGNQCWWKGTKAQLDWEKQPEIHDIYCLYLVMNGIIYIYINTFYKWGFVST